MTKEISTLPTNSLDVQDMRMRICVLDDYEDCAAQLVNWERLSGLGTVTIKTTRIPPEFLIAELREFDVIVCMRERTPLPRNLITQLTNLKLIVTTGPQNASLDLSACREMGIVVCATRAGGTAVVELAWALILSCMRGVPRAFESMANGGWEWKLGNELTGKTLGLLGLGRTGIRMAHIGAAFDMKVIAWSPNLTSLRSNQHGVQCVTKSELFDASDVVSIHLALTDSTQGIVGRDEISRMKPHSWLVNTSRAGLLDQFALVAACKSHSIAGAMLDVHSIEPMHRDDPIRTTERIHLTPHIGYVTRETFTLWFNDAIENILFFSRGIPLRVIS